MNASSKGVRVSQREFEVLQNAIRYVAASDRAGSLNLKGKEAERALRAAILADRHLREVARPMLRDHVFRRQVLDTAEMLVDREDDVDLFPAYPCPHDPDGEHHIGCGCLHESTGGD